MADLVTNGTFSGGLTGWTTAGEAYWAGVGGKAVGDAGVEGSGLGFLRQTLTGMSVGVEHTVTFTISGYFEYGPVAEGLGVSLDEDDLQVGITADGEYTYAYTPTATEGVLEFALTFGTYLELDDVVVDNPGPPDPTSDFSDDGWWRTHVRTREELPTYSPAFIFVGAEAYQNGIVDALEWVVGKTSGEIGDEADAQSLVIFDYSARDPFALGRHIGLTVAAGSPPPPFDETAFSPEKGGFIYGWFLAVADRLLAMTPATSLQLFTPADNFTRRFNLAYRAGWEATFAAVFDDDEANPEGTSKVYDTSLIVSPFDTVDYDIYVAAYDAAYTSAWGILNP